VSDRPGVTSSRCRDATTRKLVTEGRIEQAKMGYSIYQDHTRLHRWKSTKLD
jgi:hypothetical protein